MLQKSATGMPGVDQILGGGLPSGRPTLISGDAGAGKTVFCLQTLLHGANAHGEAGLYLSFEEHSAQLRAAIASFDWGEAPEMLHFHDALIDTGFETTAGFDLAGMLAILDHLCARHDIRRIVLDGIDTLLDRIETSKSSQQELGRLLEWAAHEGRTVLLTAKARRESGRFEEIYESMLFGVDCAIRLERRQVRRMSQRTLWVTKYRGSGHGENAYPFVIARQGITALYLTPDMLPPARGARPPVSTGIGGLDNMLRGGFPAGSITLFSGSPGTAKTTLSGAFILEACRRGERALLILYDEFEQRMVGHLRSVGIDLRPFIDSGLLRIEYGIAGSVGPDRHAADIRAWIDEHRPAAVAIDPLSALTKMFDAEMSWPAIEHILNSIRVSGATAVITSLTEGGQGESSTAHISTIADTWIHLAYGIRGAERNRILTIVKARGVAHDNAVHEMVLTQEGVALTDVYPIEGGMLTGSTRVARLQEDRTRELESELRVTEGTRRHVEARKRLLDEMEHLHIELRHLDADNDPSGAE